MTPTLALLSFLSGLITGKAPVLITLVVTIAAITWLPWSGVGLYLFGVSIPSALRVYRRGRSPASK